MEVWDSSPVGVYILVGSKALNNDQAYLETVSFETGCTTTDGSGACTNYHYNNKYGLKTVASGTY